MRLLANSVSVSNLNLFNHLRKKAGKCRLDGACRSILLNVAPKHDKPKKIRVLNRNWMTSPFKVGFHMAESKKPRIIVLNSSLTQRSHDSWPDNTRHDKEITFLFSFVRVADRSSALLWRSKKSVSVFHTFFCGDRTEKSANQYSTHKSKQLTNYTEPQPR